MEYDVKAIGARIANLRNEHGISQDGLGDILGLTGKHIGNVERGTYGLTLKNYLKVSELFSVSLDYLFTGALDKPLNECVLRLIKEGSYEQQEIVWQFLRALEKDRKKL